MVAGAAGKWAGRLFSRNRNLIHDPYQADAFGNRGRDSEYC